MQDAKTRKIAVVGLGTVGLFVAQAFGKHGQVIGFDINAARINELTAGIDRNHLFSKEELAQSAILCTANPEDLKQADFYIVAVPTPVNNLREPDLTPLISASKTIGHYLKPNDIVVYESSVFPGAIEEHCKPVLEKTSGLKSNKDFSIGYSPERVNPGDPEHTFTNTIKLVAAQNHEALAIIAATYNQVVEAGIFPVSSIRVAEASKILKNTQRDVYIAFMNEAAIFLRSLNIDAHEVFEAAKTKWNFVPLKPGLVGGNCIGVDTYYVIHKAHQAGTLLDVIPAARRINEAIAPYIVNQTIKLLLQQKISIADAKVAVVGITFKEDYSEVENSKVLDIIKDLQSMHVQPIITDEIANANMVKDKYGFTLTPWDELKDLDAIILATAHQKYTSLKPEDYLKKFKNKAIIIDGQHALNKRAFKRDNIILWQL